LVAVFSRVVKSATKSARAAASAADVPNADGVCDTLAEKFAAHASRPESLEGMKSLRGM
jgi:hypothetical protein